MDIALGLVGWLLLAASRGTLLPWWGRAAALSAGFAGVCVGLQPAVAWLHPLVWLLLGPVVFGVGLLQFIDFGGLVFRADRRSRVAAFMYVASAFYALGLGASWSSSVDLQAYGARPLPTRSAQAWAAGGLEGIVQVEGAVCSNAWRSRSRKFGTDVYTRLEGMNVWVHRSCDGPLDVAMVRGRRPSWLSVEGAVVEVVTDPYATLWRLQARRGMAGGYVAWMWLLLAWAGWRRR